MAGCIYHDAEAVAVCPGCDFGVCQTCMDDGSEGVCSTCSEERDMRRQHSALQREFTVEEQVARCNYCRAAADEDTPIDDHGYCPTCTTLARCCLHDDLIAVGHCKSCRKEYCRKCLGFTDVCQTCTAKNKLKPVKAPPPAAAARPLKKKASGTTPIKEGTVRAKVAPVPVGKKKAKSAPLEVVPAKVARSTQELDENGKKKKKPPSRGTLAMAAKLAAKSPARPRWQWLASGAVAFVIVIALSGLLHAGSPEDNSRHLQEQMITVHRGILHYYQLHNTLPKSANEIYTALADLKVPNPRSIHIARKPPRAKKVAGAANSVLFDVTGGSFIVTAADATGSILTDPRGDMVFLDQSYDSSNQH
jgi:hypothetical protein